MSNISFEEFMGLKTNYPNDLLFYHYCSPETFLSICSGKKLRFSDLNSMNDHLENIWGYNIWIEVANDLLQSGEMQKDFIDQIDEVLHMASLNFLRLACCLSQDGDVLSQWRAYASDASGYSIGFSANGLLKMPVRILNAIYDKEEQKNIVKAFVKSVFEVTSNKTDFSKNNDFEDICTEFAINLSCFKNSAFNEELETRLIHVAVLDTTDANNPQYMFGGGTANGKECKDYPISYRMNKSVPAVYIDIDYFYDTNPIKEVILGPKNEAHPMGVIMAMNSMGLKNVKVKLSEASYR